MEESYLLAWNDGFSSAKLLIQDLLNEEQAEIFAERTAAVLYDIVVKDYEAFEEVQKAAKKEDHWKDEYFRLSDRLNDWEFIRDIYENHCRGKYQDTRQI